MIVIVAHAQQVRGVIPGEYGVQLDVRLHNGQPVLAYGPIINPAVEPFALINWLDRDMGWGALRSVYALRIHEYSVEIDNVLSEFPNVKERAFVFDMNYVSSKLYQVSGVHWAERLSEEETYQGRSDIVWMDRWDWINDVPCGPYVPWDGRRPSITIPTCDRKGGACAVYAVSPDLHVNNAMPSWVEYFWRNCVKWHVSGICTDWWERCFKVCEEEERA